MEGHTGLARYPLVGDEFLRSERRKYGGKEQEEER